MAISKKSSKTKNPKKRGYGWVPDLPDHRDFIYKKAFKLFRRLPDQVDLANAMFTCRGSRTSRYHVLQMLLPVLWNIWKKKTMFRLLI